MAEIPVLPPQYEDESCGATLLFWYKQEGEWVEQEEELAEIETAKSILTVAAPQTGTLKKILVGEGEEVTSGMELGIIEAELPAA